tara:strand:- start:31 stop:1392 length:1362 start_codon:yes stop_codon:yes gene_type:complete
MLALMLQHFGAPSFDIYSFNVGCDQVPHVSQGACKGDSAVYRISFGLFLWFIFNTFGTLFGGKKFHTGWWILKILLFVVLIVGAFFVPNAVFGAGVGHDGLSVAGSYGYAQFSRIISAFFLVSQIVAFIDFAYHWNYSWKNNAYGGEDDEESEVTDSKWLVGLVAAFSFNLLLTVTGIILLYVFYGACSLSAFFITITAIAVVGFTCLQLTMPDSDSSLLTSSVVALYSVYLCWSAVNSNPNPKCNPTIGSTTGDDPEMIALSMAVAAFSLGWTCYSATSSATTVTAGPSVSATRSKNEAEDELKQPLNGPTSNKLRSVSEDDRSREHKNKDIEADNDQDIMDDEEDRQDAPGTAGGQSPDSRIWFFHVVMAAGSLYLAMVLTDWGTGSVSGGIHNATTATPSSSGTSQVSVYVSNSTGVAQMWVKIISEWFAIGLYTWSLIAPRIFPDREFN